MRMSPQLTPHPATASDWPPKRVSRFAGGRRAYNARRATIAQQRRQEVLRKYLARCHERGIQNHLAAEYRLHRSTISRDIHRAIQEANQSTR